MTDLSRVGLAGSRCGQCSETTLGENGRCPNCGSDDMAPVRLSDRGTVWTYTVVRHRPPGDYRGPENFEPFALGLIELPEGLRVVAPIEGDPADVSIGLDVEFTPRLRPDDVVEFAYQPVK
ncbi:OB-fold domain-containing protein [Parasphingopyxis sp. GrpM-11]|uniref:OB-fold domain-containing protein n=2 Tax=Parasphingopyxis marina TaxID=2761622 RepID=A0A842HX91_9SPHN|nr:OB-fold domain-containing protein [Parasphingopyxis marina]